MTSIFNKNKKLFYWVVFIGMAVIIATAEILTIKDPFNVKATSSVDTNKIKTIKISDIGSTCSKIADQIRETIDSKENVAYYNDLIVQNARDTDFLDVYRVVCVDKDNRAYVYEFYVKYFGSSHHGIFRYIYSARTDLYGEAIMQPVDNIEVLYWNVKEPSKVYSTYDTSYIEQEKPAYFDDYKVYPETVFLKIGDEDKTITGIWAYKISYRQFNVVYKDNSSEDDSVVFSDIILPDFQDRSATYYRVNSVYILPKGAIDFYAELKDGANYKDIDVQRFDLQDTDLYTVSWNKQLRVVDPDVLQANTIRFTAVYKNGVFADKLSEYKKTINDSVNFIDENISRVRTLGILITVVGIFLIYYIWATYGRDKRPPAVAPEYVVDKELKKFGFMEMEILMSLLKSSNKGLSKSVTADVINLARKGYIKIDHKSRSKTYINLISKDLEPGEIWYYNDLLSYITNGYSLVTTVSNLDLGYKLKKLRGRIWKKLKQNGFIKSAGTKITFILWGTVIGTIFALLFSFSIIYDKSESVQNLGIIIESVTEKVNSLMGLTLLEMIVVTISGVIAGIYMPKRTEKGYELYVKLLGLKRYIEKAEIKELKFFNDPDKLIEHFEELLPFAILFGLEKKWLKRFKKLLAELNYNPSWYNSYYGWSSIRSITNSINSLSSVTHTIASSSLPSSYSSGGSFSAGGGGGTSGGGGGGTW